ncbi:hypothetical protein [Deinococcus sp. AJ005]|uniref:hypothetical protein n=1 Tax=Deinococcus sp. AJ005 TaxID=2652443 RepID=UPI00125CA85E|nr:hypothetical protein [Deinococcus sp. AJ005]QFP75061.1 hypothetical protein DAAJ005_00390 [Deinococcus sp. AJ005]
MKQDQAGIEKFLDGLLSAYLGKYDSRTEFENSLRVMAPLFERADDYKHIDDTEIISMGLSKFDEAVRTKLLN